MTVLEDGNVIKQATRNDRRVTRFGALLRQTSLDELPQFFQRAAGSHERGRPAPPRGGAQRDVPPVDQGYMIRHKVRPGSRASRKSTVCAGDRYARQDAARIEHDLEYLRNWSLQLDLQIVVKTIFVLLKKPDAF